MTVFAQVVGTGSLSRGRPGPRHVPGRGEPAARGARSALGVRLVNRTTRSLHLTDEGATYYETCTRVLADIEEADAPFPPGGPSPRGVLRVALPASFGNQHVAPLVPKFAERYPAVQLALSLSDRTVNLVEEGFDLAIRIAELADSSLAARKLAPNRRVVCASPAYLRRHGTPRTPEDLAKHNCLSTDFAMNWDYRDPDGKAGSVRVAAAMPATTGKCCANGRSRAWASR